MKKYLMLLCICCGVAAFTEGNAAQYHKINDIRELDTNGDGQYDANDNFDPCATYQTGPAVCYVPVTRFCPQQYCTQRCVQEPYTVEKQNCRYVPEYYKKQYCRYVPQYYEKTHCRYVPQTYTTCETKYRNKMVTDTHVRYVPKCTVEKRCCDVPCPPQPACPPACPPQVACPPACPACPVCPQPASKGGGWRGAALNR